MKNQSFGKPGYIIEFLENPTKLQDQSQKISDLIELLNSPLFFRFQYFQKNSFNLEQLKELLEIWIRYFREKLLKIIFEQNLNQESIMKLEKTLKVLQEINYYIFNTNINQRLAFESLMLRI